jgi:hypothetical protein
LHFVDEPPISPDALSGIEIEAQGQIALSPSDWVRYVWEAAPVSPGAERVAQVLHNCDDSHVPLEVEVVTCAGGAAMPGCFRLGLDRFGASGFFVPLSGSRCDIVGGFGDVTLLARLPYRETTVPPRADTLVATFDLQCRSTNAAGSYHHMRGSVELLILRSVLTC